ncbi:F-box protein skip23 [Rhynchospora pubera]|uniref:F-box protein skip23 n=1 Tax=Rhynchospora pubera TaxID=906938 RepID=A0AAV8EF09_9POAL|nr:F-box protein skip23 [Rhynchospora pubera]
MLLIRGNPSLVTTSFAVMEAEKAAERDWSSLAPELLNLIAKNLSEISDFIRFRAVCTPWRLSTPITDLPPQFPWILEKRGYYFEPHMHFYSTTSSKMYAFHDPKYLRQRVFGSSQGYMLSEFCDPTTIRAFTSPYTVHTYQISLFNPLNNHKITLPACDLGLYSYSYWIGPQQYQIGEYVVRGGYFNHRGYQLAFCRLGQDNWFKFNSENYCDGCPDFGFFHIKSMLFRVDDDTGVTYVFDLTTGNLAYVLPQVEDPIGNYYIVDASGHILIVFQCFGASDDSHDFWFHVYQLDFSGGSSPHWVKVNNIGNQALFIDLDGGIALEASDFAGINANCIYYIEQSWVKRIDIETGDQELLQCPFEEPERWFVPNLGHLQS